MSSTPPIIASDRECLASARRGDISSLRLLAQRYLPFVHSSALRRTGDMAQAAEVTRAVFIVLGRRARKLGRKTVLVDWLFHVTAVASRKVKRTRWWHRFGRKRQVVVPANATLWMRVAPEIDRALAHLPRKQRTAALLCGFLNFDFTSASRILRTREPRARKWFAQALRKLAKRLRKYVPNIEPDALSIVCAAEGCSSPVPESLRSEILQSLEQSRGRRPSLKLARHTLSALAWARWRRRFALGIPAFVLLLATLLGTAWHIDSRSGHSRLISAFLTWSVRREAKTVPGLAQPARPWPANADLPRLSTASARSARDIFQTTNIWHAHLDFSREQWKALEPKHIGALPNFLQEDGTALLRNPKAQRSGLAGVLGYDFNWVHADFEFGGIVFTNVAARIKGNGTWLGSLYGAKHPFKVDLNRFVPARRLAGLDEFTFNNLVIDHSFMSDALAYEFFREAGVPAPRTAYAWLTASVAKQWDQKPLGLYVMVEAVDAAFAADRFGSKKTPVFKPVTYKLFQDMGNDWPAYAAVYDLKTKATPAQQRRVIEFARLVSHANDAEFAMRVGDFLDLDEFARFLAGEVLLSAYDGILSTGQNFYLYLDSRSNKFGFIPWDLDLAWGGFFLLGTKKERERASIWHPWVGENRFIERVMGVEEFRRIYRAHLEDFLARLFVPARLNERIDEMAAVVRSPVAAESDFRLNKFEQAVGAKPLEPPAPRTDPMGANRQAHQLKGFIEKRIASVRAQLDGKSKGVILKRRESVEGREP